MTKRRKPKSVVIRNPTFEALRAPGKAMNERQMLEWALVFMLMHHDPVRDHDWWFDYCVRKSCQYTINTYPHVFWWSLRYYGDSNDWSEWRSYLDYKLEQHKLPVNGPASSLI